MVITGSFGKVYVHLVPNEIRLHARRRLLCTFATNSKIFIAGRAVAGLGVSVIAGGFLKLLKHLFPLHKQALMVSIVGGCQSVGLVSAPIIGGALIDTLTWRACFGINIPLGVMCIALIAYGFEDPLPHPHGEMPFRAKLKQMDLFGTLLAVPAITILVLALQWGATHIRMEQSHHHRLRTCWLSNPCLWLCAVSPGRDSDRAV